MRILLVLAMLFAVCLILTIGGIQANGPAPVGAPAKGNDGLSSSIVAEVEGAPAGANDTLLSGIVAAPEGHPSPEFVEPFELSIIAPHGEPVASP